MTSPAPILSAQKHALITQHREQLLKGLEGPANGDVWEHLLRGSVVTLEERHDLKDKPVLEQHTWLLDHVASTCSDQQYDALCEALVSCGLVQLVKDYLTPKDQSLLSGQTRPLQAAIARLYLTRLSRVDLYAQLGSNRKVALQEVYQPMSWLRTETEVKNSIRQALPHYTDLLNWNTRPRRVLVTGRAGCGKSTFVRKLAVDWAEVHFPQFATHSGHLDDVTKARLQEVDMLITITLREVRAHASLQAAVQHQLDLVQPAEAAVLLDFIGKNPERAVLVIDGLDEQPLKDSSDIMKLIKGELFPGVLCIFTCRPHVHSGIRRHAGSEVELEGFSKEQATTYVNSYFKSVDRSGTVGKGTGLPGHDPTADLAASLLTAVDASEELMALSHIPCTLNIMCTLWLENRQIGTTTLDLYVKYIDLLLAKYRQKTKKEKQKAGTNFRKKYKDLLLQLGTMALTALTVEDLELIFLETKVRENLGDEVLQQALESGILVRLPVLSSSGETFVSFAHRSIQEYLAALFVVSCGNTEAIEFLAQLCSTTKRLVNSQLILQFVCELSTSMKSSVQESIEKMIKTWQYNEAASEKDRNSLLFDLLRDNKHIQFPLPRAVVLDLEELDSQRSKFSRLFQKKGNLDRYLRMDGSLLRELDVKIASWKQLDMLSPLCTEKLEVVRIRGIGWNTATAIPESFLNLLDNSVSLSALEIKKCYPMHTETPEAIFSLCSRIHRFHSLQVINMSCTPLGEDGVKEITEAIKVLTSMRALQLSDCGCDDPQTWANLFSQLARLSQMEILNVSRNRIGSSGADSLATVISGLFRLKKLGLRRSMPKRGPSLGTLLQAISGVPSLEVLDLCKNEFRHAEKDVTDALVKLSQLSYLNLGHTPNLNHDSLSTALWPRLVYLRYLDISFSEGEGSMIPDTGYPASLQVLRLHGNNLGNRGVKKLAAVVQKLPRLQWLDMGDCNCSDGDAMAEIFRALKHLPEIEILRVCDNIIGDVSLEALATVLPCVKKLKVLCITSSEMSDERLQKRVWDVGRHLTGLVIVGLPMFEETARGTEVRLDKLDSLYEILYQLGLEDSLVSCTCYCQRHIHRKLAELDPWTIRGDQVDR